MELAGVEWVAVVLLGAVLAADHAVWPSLLLAQPLVGGLVAGWLGGHPHAGLAAGAVLQMVWMVAQPVGGAAVAEGWLGGFAAALCAPADLTLAGGAWLDDPRLAAPAVVGLAAAALGRWVLLAQRAGLQRLGAGLGPALAAGNAAPAGRLHALGFGLHAARGAGLALLVAGFAPSASAAFVRLGIEAPAGRIALALSAVALAGCAPRAHRWAGVGVGLVAGALVAWL